MKIDARKLELAMIENCLNGRQLSQKASVSQNVVSAILNGRKTNIRIDTLGKLSKTLQLQPRALLEDESSFLD